ncbi:MAG: nucleotide exchange factor GrpE [Dehalococcoidia bacterium]|nr:nucleotide exchange factor GrpE [Dehalococcoidia bacterium]
MTAHEDERVVDRRAASRMNDDEAQGATGPTETGPPVQDAPLHAQLTAEREKAESYYKNWQRSAADFINFKRRVEQERDEAAHFARAALVINLLPVYDDMERAVTSVDAQLAGLNWVQGVVAIQRKFWHLLDALGVSEIAAAGADFDPALHEAVAHQPGADGKVLHVVQKGYRLGDRVVRPAMVVVGDGTAATGTVVQ